MIEISNFVFLQTMKFAYSLLAFLKEMETSETV